VKDLQDAAKKTSTLTEAEIKRRTEAEILASMTSVFPLELCVVALERCKDDMQFAANWLFENGMKELERMQTEMIARSRQEEAEQQDAWLKQLVQENAGEFDISSLGVDPSSTTGASSSSGSSSSSSSRNDSSNDMEDMNFNDDEGGEEDGLNSQEAERYLDDELGADAPVQIARTAQRQEVESVKIDELYPGMLLRVCSSAATNPTWHPSMDAVIGRTGVVTAVNKDQLSVELRFFDCDTCSKSLPICGKTPASSSSTLPTTKSKLPWLR